MRSPITYRTRLLLLAILLLALFALSACKTPQSVQHTVVQRDSVVVYWLPRDTVITVPRDSVVLHVHLPPPGKDLPPVRSTQGGATAELAILDGLATVRCLYDSLALELRLWERFQREASYQRDQRREVVVETRTPKWAWYALGAALLLALWRLWPLLKHLFKPL